MKGFPMSQFVHGPTKTFAAGAALAANRRVKIVAGVLQYAGATDPCIGTLESATFADSNFASGYTDGTVRLITAEGTRKFVASEAISAGNGFYAAESGKVAATGTVIEGKAMEAATADLDVIEGLATHNSDIATSISGTTAATFETDSDLGKPRAALGSQTGGTGDFKAIVKPPATLTADRTYTLVGDANDSLVGAAAVQTLTNKTLTSPTLTTPTLTSPVITTPTGTDATEVVTATDVISAAESGTTFFLNSATEFVSTLPAPAAGLRYRWIVSAAPSGASYTIVTNSSSNIIKGNIVCSQDAGGTADSETSGGDTISLVDGKAVAGDMVEVYCDGTNWFAYGTSKVFDAITITTAS